jgi:hypothetical protein
MRVPATTPIRRRPRVARDTKPGARPLRTRRIASPALLAALAVVAGGCGSDDDTGRVAGDRSAKVDRFELRSADLPQSDYYVRQRPSRRVETPTCASRRIARQMKRVGAVRCAWAGFGRGEDGFDTRSGASAVTLFAYRFRRADAAASALPRMRRYALRGLNGVIGAPVGAVGSPTKHSLPALRAGDEAARGVVLRYQVPSTAQFREIVYLWRQDNVVAGLVFVGDDKLEDPKQDVALVLDRPAQLRLAQRIDARTH